MKKCTSLVRAEPVLGVDIAQATFVAVLRVDETRQAKATFPNHAGGFRQLRTWLHQHFSNPVRAGLEATGIYSRDLATWLHGEGHQVHVLNPARVAAYAKSIGQRNKTDPADARMIAQYVAHHALPLWTPPAPEHAELQALTRLRQQLGEQRQRLVNEHASAAPIAQGVLHRLIADFDRELARLDAELKQHLAAHPQLAAQVERLTTVPGIGWKTATVVLAELPAVTFDSDPRALCAWAGLTPARHQSGTHEAPSRLSRAGNVYLRHALYMPSLVAKRHNPIIHAFAERLARKGTRHRALLGALSHKLLRILIGLLRHGQDFDPNWSPQKS
jgi:transposase